MSRNPNKSLVSILSQMSLNDRMTYYMENNRKATNSKTIYISELDFYMTNPMAQGNSKLDKSILIFDLLAIVSCLNCKSCKNTCYALKSQKQYVNVLLKRTLNTYLAKHELNILYSAICNQLSHTKKHIVRIHSSGDFLSQAYIDMWANIAHEFTNVRFYTYTKVNHIFDFSAFESLNNANIVHSILPDNSINYGSLDVMTD